MLDSDEEDEGEGGVAGEPTVGGGEPTGGTPVVGEDEELSNDNENFSHVSSYSVMYCTCQCSPSVTLGKNLRGEGNTV